MGHDDLERRLRTERGPREAGYAPADLPATIEQRERPRRAASVMRFGLLAGAAVAALLAVAVVSGLGRGGSGGVGSGSASATPSASGTTPSDGSACAAADLHLAAEPWGGAAGSRGTVVTVTLVGGVASCEMTDLQGRMVDATGARLVISPQRFMVPAQLDMGASYTIGVAWSNWCDAAPSAPVGLQVTFDGATWLPVPAAGGADPVPPCIGSDPTSLSVTALQPAP